MEKELQKEIDRGMGLGIIKDNPRRFLRYLAKEVKGELVLTRTLQDWENDPQTTKVATWFTRRRLWPKERARLIQITKVLIQKYDYPIAIPTARLARKIQKDLGDTIEQYTKEKISKHLKFRMDNQRPIITHTPEEALAEQIAQGFIKKQDYTEFCSEHRHCYSLVDRDYIYPYNFVWGAKQGIHITKGLQLVGVSGFTRISQ